VDIGAFQYQYDLATTGSEAFVKGSTGVTYNFTVTNNGPDTANNVKFTDFLPAYSTFAVQLPPSGWNLMQSANTITITDSNLLTAGTLTTPAVSTEGQSITKALRFHFTDGDSQGQASDFTATVVWGDGTSNTSADKSGTVSVAANTNGGFDVFGTHTFDEVPSGATFGVLIQDVAGAVTGVSTTSFTVADPSVKATARSRHRKASPWGRCRRRWHWPI